MHNDPMINAEQDPENLAPADTGDSSFIYPPKLYPEEKKGNVWIRSLSSLALYLLIGYYFFSANWTLLLILTAIVVFHEMGHFIAMKMYNYKDLGIFFIPLLGAYASGTKQEVSQKQSSIILLAGPLPGIILGFILFFITRPGVLDGVSYQTMYLMKQAAGMLILLNLLNLLPIYPLDGGQLLNRLFLDDSNIISKIFVVISAGVLTWFALFGLGRPFYPLLIFPAMILLRLRTDNTLDQVTKAVESKGINIEKAYEDVTDEEYWKIRNILIENNYPPLKNIRPAPPYEYAANEEKVVTAIESILQRSIIQDLSVFQKILIILIWVACFVAPFLVDLRMPF